MRARTHLCGRMLDGWTIVGIITFEAASKMLAFLIFYAYLSSHMWEAQRSMHTSRRDDGTQTDRHTGSRRWRTARRCERDSETGICIRWRIARDSVLRQSCIGFHGCVHPLVFCTAAFVHVPLVHSDFCAQDESACKERSCILLATYCAAEGGAFSVQDYLHDARDYFKPLANAT